MLHDDDEKDDAAPPLRDALGRWLPGRSACPAGRPIGSRSRLRRRLDQAISHAAVELLGSSEVIGSDDEVPPESGLELLRRVYRDRSKPLDIRMAAAQSAAKFEQPALSASMTAVVDPPPRGRDNLSPEERRARINALLAERGLPLLPAPASAIEGEAVERGSSHLSVPSPSDVQRGAGRAEADAAADCQDAGA